VYTTSGGTRSTRPSTRVRCVRVCVCRWCYDELQSLSSPPPSSSERPIRTRVRAHVTNTKNTTLPVRYRVGSQGRRVSCVRACVRACLCVQVISLSQRSCTSRVHYYNITILLFYGYVGASCCCQASCRVHNVCVCGPKSWPERRSGCAAVEGGGVGDTGRAAAAVGPGVREIILSFFVTNFRMIYTVIVLYTY